MEICFCLFKVTLKIGDTNPLSCAYSDPVFFFWGGGGGEGEGLKPRRKFGKRCGLKGVLKYEHLQRVSR